MTPDVARLDLLGLECLGQAAVKDSRGKEWKKLLLKGLRPPWRNRGRILGSLVPSAAWLWAKVSFYGTAGLGPGKAKHLIHMGQRKESRDRERWLDWQSPPAPQSAYL